MGKLGKLGVIYGGWERKSLKKLEMVSWMWLDVVERVNYFNFPYHTRNFLETMGLTFNIVLNVNFVGIIRGSHVGHSCLIHNVLHYTFIYEIAVWNCS